MPQHAIQMTVKQAEKNFGIEIIDASSGAPLPPSDKIPPPKRGRKRKVRISDHAPAVEK